MEADCVIDPHETEYLDKVIHSFNLTRADLDSVDELDLTSLISDFKRFSAPKKEYARRLFVEMANCDGYADLRELKIINSLATS